MDGELPVPEECVRKVPGGAKKKPVVSDNSRVEFMKTLT